MARNAKYAGSITGVLFTGRTGGRKRFVWGARATGGGVNPTAVNQGYGGPVVRDAKCACCLVPQTLSLPRVFINRCHFFVHIRTSAYYGVALTAFLASCRNCQANSRHNPSRFEPIRCNFDLACACLLVECVRACELTAVLVLVERRGSPPGGLWLLTVVSRLVAEA